jgi:anaerobic magnesium-protoporphyrin IX monomethyl ester cyclase
MAADVLITHSNHIYSDAKQVQKMQPYPALQTLIVASLLRQSGISVSLFDPTFVNPYEGFIAALEEQQPKIVLVCEDDFNFLSKMCLFRNRELAFWAAGEARRRGATPVVHGSDASDHVREYISAGFDAVLLGEVETTALEYVQGAPRHMIRGLAYTDETGAIRYNARRELRVDLDTLPGAAWDLVDLHAYREAWTGAHGYFSMNLVSSRGCPYRCNWCAKPIYGNNYHVRNPRAVAEEVADLKNHKRAEHIWFADDIFGLSARWTREFSRTVQDLNARIAFKMQSRCDLMTRETVQDLAQAGCAEVWMGAESGSQKILDAMDKSLRIDQIYEARENLRRHGIRACFFIQFGYPGEDWEQIQQTVNMVRQAAPDDIGVSISYPLPGTKFFELVSHQLGTKANWIDSNDLSMMFRSTYSTEFYRALTHALHLEVRGGEGLDGAWDKVYSLRGQEVVC